MIKEKNKYLFTSKDLYKLIIELLLKKIIILFFSFKIRKERFENGK